MFKVYVSVQFAFVLKHVVTQATIILYVCKACVFLHDFQSQIYIALFTGVHRYDWNIGSSESPAF